MTSERFVENFGPMHLAESLRKAGHVCVDLVANEGWARYWTLEEKKGNSCKEPMYTRC